MMKLQNLNNQKHHFDINTADCCITVLIQYQNIQIQSELREFGSYMTNA